MTITYSTAVADVAEEHATHDESFGLERTTAKAVLRVAWADRYTLVDDIVGNSRVWPYALEAGRIGPRATTAGIMPCPGSYVESGQGMIYTDALVTVNYDSNVGTGGGSSQGSDSDPQDPETENLFAEEIEPTAEFITLDHKRFRWGAQNGDPLLEQEAPGKLVKGLNLVRTFYKVPPPLPIQILDAVGGVNASGESAPILGLSFDKETLLYQPPNLSRTIKTDGTGFAFTIKMKYSYKPQGWNKFWRSKTQEMEEIYDFETGIVVKNYPLVNFGPIWAFG